MNRFLFFFLLIGCFGVMSAQERLERGGVPNELVASFERDYQQAANLRWESRPGGGFIAVFEWNQMPTEAHYDSYGDWLYTENFISRDQLPQTAQIHLRRRYGQREPSSIGHHDAFSGSYFFVRIGSTEWRYDKQGSYIGSF